MWQLDRSFLVSFLTLQSWVGAAEQDVHEWEDRSFYGGETGPGLSFPHGLFQGGYHFSPSHLLKIAPTLHQQRQSRQDMARAFIFTCSPIAK